MRTSIRINNIVRIVLIIAFAALLYSYFSSSQNTKKGKGFRKPKFNRKPTQRSAMASQYLESIASRRSIYALSKESTISNARIKEILTETIKHSPSSFNNQAQRAVLLLGAEHDTFWEIAREHVKTSLGEKGYNGLKSKIDGYQAGYGTVAWFEDNETLKPFQEKNPGLPFGQWGAHSQGMVQIHTWDAFELEGLGGNLQHYNFMPSFEKAVKEHWKLPESWDLHAQLVFGKPTAQPHEKSFDQVDGKRLLVFGDSE